MKWPAPVPFPCPSWRSWRPAVVLLSAALVGGGTITGSWARSPGNPAANPDLTGINGPVIETLVAGLRIEGSRPFDRLVIEDLDILVTDPDIRLLPLLRILDALGQPHVVSDSLIAFQPPRLPRREVRFPLGTATDGNENWSFPIVSGLSDITLAPEIYVPETILAALLGIDLAWDDRSFGFTLTSSAPLPLFDRKSGRSADPGQAALASDLPGLLPPARPSGSIPPRIDFLRLRTQGNAVKRSSADDLQANLSSPRLDLWGRLLGGDVTLSATCPLESDTRGIRFDRAAWTLGGAGWETVLGTSSFGLSDLCFPSLQLVGLRFNGLAGGDGDTERDPSRLGVREAFFRTHRVVGSAPVGSTVTLTIDGRFVDRVTVTGSPDGPAPPGEGDFRFEGLNLFINRVNRLELEITRPDGSVEYRQQEVLGSDRLAPAGQVSFLGGIGGRYRPSGGDLEAEGLAVAGRIRYGVHDRLTLGLFGGHQEDLYREDPIRFSGRGVQDTIPGLSSHAGASFAWQAAGPLIVEGSAAGSEQSGPDERDWAARLSARFHAGPLRFYPAVFRNGPGFFDGRNPELRDIEGSALSLRWRIWNRQELTLGAGTVRDNLAGDQPSTTRVRDAVAHWGHVRVLPRTTLGAGVNLVWIDDSSPLSFGVLNLDSSLLRGWTLRSQSTVGNDLRRSLRYDLPAGKSDGFDRIRQQGSLFDARGALGATSRSTRIDLRRRLGTGWQLTFSHRYSRGYERSFADLSRTATYGERWQGRLTPGYDWELQVPVLQARLEWLVGGSYRNRLTLEGETAGSQWYVRLAAQIQLDVGFRGGRPRILGQDNLDPDQGGVLGRVFLDRNGNGLADSGEPGVPGIPVSCDLGWGIVSGSDGIFIIPNTGYRRRTRVSLDAKRLPAVYTPTQGRQEAILAPGRFTGIDLGIAVFPAVSGRVSVRDQAGELQPVVGIRVLLVNADGVAAGRSITSSSGEFYLGEVRPGGYVLRLDESSLPPDFLPDTRERVVEVEAADDYFEMKGLDFTGFRPPAPDVRDEGPQPAPDRLRIFD